MSNRFGCAVLILAFGGHAIAAVPLNATAVSAGASHLCAIVGGAAQCWGGNDSGQLGVGDTEHRILPTLVHGAESGTTAISSGYSHSCAIVNGGAKCWGYDADGELGDGGTGNASTAVAVQTLGSGVIAISAGEYHTCAIVGGGAVKCWGANFSGQLGDGSTNATKTNPPVTVGGISGATAIAAGANHTCALAGGAVKCWGYNGDGEIDSGVAGDSHTPVAAVGLSSGVTAIAAGWYHSCAIVAGAVKCWGLNRSGELGDSTYNSTNTNPPVAPIGLASGVTALAGGFVHTCALAGGAVKCWGDNRYGQLGIGSLTTLPTPTPVPALSNISALSAGEYTSCALGPSGNGNVTHCWGENYSGQLGLGEPLNRYSANAIPTVIGATHIAHGATALHSCAVVAGAAKCWGNGENGQLGDGARVSSSTPVDVSGLSSGVADVAVGYESSCALLTSGAVECWGGNTNGDLGIGGSFPSPLPAITIASGASAIALGYFHGCAIVGAGVQCWGANPDGELGDGTTTLRTSPVAVIGLAGTPVSIAAGVSHTCVALSNGKIQCWGSNAAGQLGDNSTHSTLTNPPITVANIASGATQVAAGGFHTCAIVNQSAKCWGSGYSGALGNGLFSQSLVPVDVTGWNSTVEKLAGGYDYTCGIRNGAAYCWGHNMLGDTGTGTDSFGTPALVQGLMPGIVDIAGASSHSCALSGGSLSCWGTDFFGELADSRTIFAETPRIVIQGDAIFASGFEN